MKVNFKSDNNMYIFLFLPLVYILMFYIIFQLLQYAVVDHFPQTIAPCVYTL